MTPSQSHYFISGHEVPICLYSFCICFTRFYCKEFSNQLLVFFTMNSYRDDQACHDPSLVVRKTVLAIQLIFTSGDFLLIFTISCAKNTHMIVRICTYTFRVFICSFRCTDCDLWPLRVPSNCLFATLGMAPKSSHSFLAF